MALVVNIQKKLAHYTLNVAASADKNEGPLALLGPSGCGKSMTLKCIAGIERPDEGRIELDGRVLFDSEKGICVAAQERNIGYLFQNYALFPHMSVLENVACAVPKKVASSREARRKEAVRLLEKLQVAELSGQLAAKLSGGQQQRVAMARMLAARPALMLFDEPTSALDSYLRWQVELELAELMQKSGVPSVLVSHNRDEVYRLCSQVCVLDKGVSGAKQHIAELFSHPKTVVAAQISGCKNIVAAHVVDTSACGSVRLSTAWGPDLFCEQQALGSLKPEEVTHLGVRAHYFELSPQAPSAGAEELAPDANWVEVEIAQVIASPFSQLVMLKMPAGNLVRYECSKELWHTLEKAGLALGSAAWLHIPSSALMPLTAGEHQQVVPSSNQSTRKV